MPYEQHNGPIHFGEEEHEKKQPPKLTASFLGLTNKESDFRNIDRLTIQ